MAETLLPACPRPEPQREEYDMRRRHSEVPRHLGGTARAALAAVAVLAAGCASQAVPVPSRAAAATHSAVIVQQGDAAVQDALRRIVLGADSRIVETLIEDGAFNDAVSDDEAASFLALAQRIEVRPDADARDPARGARRLVYAMLAARVVAKGTWSDADTWFNATPDQGHRNDIAAGFAVTDWWPDGHVAAPRTDAESDAWCATFERILRATTDQMAKRRLVRNAHGKLGLLPRNAAEPEAGRSRAAEFVLRLIDNEDDDGTRAELRAALAATGFAAPATPATE